jgi:hypothetical protein
MLKYKGALVGILVRDDADEEDTSITWPRLREGCSFQQETPGLVRMFLRLEGTGGRERSPEHLRKSLPGISREGE